MTNLENGKDPNLANLGILMQASKDFEQVFSQADVNKNTNQKTDWMFKRNKTRCILEQAAINWAQGEKR